jgi:sulfide dehydrogenase cytochrome subunit
MCALAKTLSASQIKDVGTYYAAQKWIAAQQQGLDAAEVAKGRSIQAANCAICHTKGGSVADDDASILAGQWLAYSQVTPAGLQGGKTPASKYNETKNREIVIR